MVDVPLPIAFINLPSSSRHTCGRPLISQRDRGGFSARSGVERLAQQFGLFASWAVVRPRQLLLVHELRGVDAESLG